MRELIKIENENIKFIIKGKPVHPYNKTEEKDKKFEKVIQVEDYLNSKLVIKNYITEENKLIDYNGGEISPLFYEQQNLNVFIRDKQDGKMNLTFHHNDSSIESSVEDMDEGVLSGIINFRNHIGYSTFILKSNGKKMLKLTIKVFPTKIDYEDDYKMLMKDINDEVYNLSFDFLKRTFQEMGVVDQEHISDSEFFSILQNIFDAFVSSFRRIDTHTHHKLEKISKVKRAGRVKKVSRKGIKWLNKNSHFYNKEKGTPKKFLDIDKRITYNTFENRFVKWMIKDIIKRVEKFRVNYEESFNKFYKNNEPDKKVLAKIDFIKGKLRGFIHLSFLKDVGDIYKLDSLSLVMQMAPGYRDIYKYYVMLKKGLNIESDLFKLSMKDTAELYEYWCFLKINQILRKNYKLISEDIVEFDYSGINVSLKKGKNSKINYINPRTKEEFSLIYNKKEGKEITVGQKPDYILELKKNDSEVHYKFIFDAKYRLDNNNDDGPTKESINAMHRYRDAIVTADNNEYKRTMVGAYVLFPNGNEEKYKKHKFYKSIEKLNIGGYPFLPGSIKLMTNFLNRLINESALSSYERNILPVGGSEYSDNISFDKNVLIGTIKSKKQLEFIKDKLIYHMPLRKGDDFLKKKVKYITIYQSNRVFDENAVIKFYGKIKKWEIKNRKEIPFKKKRKRRNGLYHYFELEEMKELENPIKVKDFGPKGRFHLTNKLLLERAKYYPELTLDDNLEWRIWIELNRAREISENEKYTFYINGVEFNVYSNTIEYKSEKIDLSNKRKNIIKIAKRIKNKIIM